VPLGISWEAAEQACSHESFWQLISYWLTLRDTNACYAANGRRICWRRRFDPRPARMIHAPVRCRTIKAVGLDDTKLCMHIIAVQARKSMFRLRFWMRPGITTTITTLVSFSEDVQTPLSSAPSQSTTSPVLHVSRLILRGIFSCPAAGL
jgi:hypothetical protein